MMAAKAGYMQVYLTENCEMNIEKRILNVENVIELKIRKEISFCFNYKCCGLSSKLALDSHVDYLLCTSRL